MNHRTPILAVVVGLAVLAPPASAAPGDVVNKAEASFPTLATAATVEKVETEKGLELRATDSEGRAVDIEALAGDDRAKRRDAFGALDVLLARRLDRLRDDQPVPVAIWLVEPEHELGERPQEGASSDDVEKLSQVQTERRAAEVAEITAPFMERLREFDREAAASTSSPLVWDRSRPGSSASSRRTSGSTPSTVPSPGVAPRRTCRGRSSARTSHRPPHSTARASRSGSWRPVASRTHQSVHDDLAQRSGPSCTATSAHATGVAGIIGARPGVSRVWFPDHELAPGFAPAARLSVGSWCNTGDHRPSIDSAANWGARVITNSYWTDATGAVTADDRHADGLVHDRWRLFVKSAGNRGGGDSRVTSPGNGYNVLAVGNVDLHGTAARADDTMASTSSSVDPTSTQGDREKPEVSAPGSDIRMLSSGNPWSGQINSGTSFAAPMVAGTAARLIQRKPYLGIWPEQLRAILMASATNNVEGAIECEKKDKFERNILVAK